MEMNIGLHNIDLNKKSMPMIFSLTKHNILYKILHQEKNICTKQSTILLSCTEEYS